jgi:hypothetical protein
MYQRNSQNSRSLKIFFWLLKVILYAGFAVAYYFLVLLLLRNWLKQTFDDHKAIYALITLPLIIAQAALLDFVTFVLRKWGQGKEK